MTECWVEGNGLMNGDGETKRSGGRGLKLQSVNGKDGRCR